MTEEKVIGNGKPWLLNKDTISIMVVVVVQTLTVTWFLAGQNSALNAVIKAVSAAETTTYKKEEAVREREFQNQVQKNMSDKVDELTRRITILEGQGQARVGPGVVRP